MEHPHIVKHTPTVSERFTSRYNAARERATAIPRTDRGWVVVSGADRASYLQGLLTNDIAALQRGSGCYAAYLTPQGRMITDLDVYELGDLILLAAPSMTTPTLLEKLDQFIFSEDVQLGDVSTTFAGVSIVGPDAARALAAVLDMPPDVIEGLPDHGNLRTSFQDQAAILLRVGDRGVAGFDLLVDRGQEAALLAALDAAQVVLADEEVAETLRVEAGVPLFGRDMTAETIPLEAGIESRAISLTKGCYVGQEVIIRVLHRGHGRVAKKLVGLTLTEAVPAAGEAVEAADRSVGHVTSATWSPLLQCPIALAYVHRDFIEPGTALRVGAQPAVVAALPFHQ